MIGDKPLYTSASAAFIDDGNGSTVAQCSVSPQVFGVTWTVKRIVISTTSSGLNGSSRFFLYLNSIGPSTLIDGTYSGDQDFSETQLEVNTLDTLIAVWTGGDIGSIAQINVSGDWRRQ